LIKGLSADNARPVPPTTAKRKTERAESFADQLTGAKSETDLEKSNRSERQNSGRGPDAQRERELNREESRSNEREKSSQRSSSDLNASRDELNARGAEPRGRDSRDVDRDRERDRDRDDRSNDRGDVAGATSYSPTSNQHIQTPTRMPDSSSAPSGSDDDTAPIVIENPKNSESKELKLPDFFSKAALEKGAKVSAKAATGKDAKGLEVVDPAAALAAMKETEGLTRKEAMEKFVSKMQNELGIPPEKLLAAFAKLDDKAMKESPEESMGQFLKALDLTSGDEAKAGVLYKDLLKTTGDSLMSERLAGLEAGVNFDVMSPRDSALRKLSSSLEDLNMSFFRKEAGDSKKAEKSLESMDAELSKLMHQPSSVKDQQALNASALGVAANAAMLADGGADTADAASAGLSQIDANALAGLMAQQSSLNGLAAGSQGEGDLGDMLGGQASHGAAKAAGGKSALQSAFAEEMSKEVKDKDTDVATEKSGKTDLAQTDPRAVIGQDQPAVTSSGPRPLMGPADMMMNKPATAQDEEDNVKELIKQAQIMVKRGGGEMKMEMKPEGMGNIQLRVNVQNGQVNVQMLTESESAKNLLERGLSELKTNLAAHELKVQSLSVDIGNDVKNQMDQQATQDHARQQARQFASDFMGSFRDEQQGFRQGFLENKGWRQYAHNKGPDSLSPEQVSRAAATARSDNSSSGQK
jgi:flagellar hook-length control protein FliK